MQTYILNATKFVDVEGNADKVKSFDNDMIDLYLNQRTRDKSF